MPAEPDHPKPGRPRRRRFLRRVAIVLLVLLVLAGLGLVFLPQIATKVIGRLTARLDLERFEVTVEDVRWNEATLTGLDAADGGWEAHADTIVVRYDPWDLFDGKVQKLILHGFRFGISDHEPEPGDGESPLARIHVLPAMLGSCPEVDAPGARLTIPRGAATVEEPFDLTLRQRSAQDLTLSLESDAQRVTADLEAAEAGSTLTVRLSTPDPAAWLATVESLLGADSAYLPKELALGPLEGEARLLISDKVDEIAVAGSMTGLRYARASAVVDARSSRTTFEGVIRPGGLSQVDLRGDLAVCDLKIDAIPGGSLTLPGGSRPEWTARLAWEPGSFSYSGKLEKAQLSGGEDGRPLELTQGAATFSNREALFRTGGKAHLNGLPLPFHFVLLRAAPAPSSAPNATATLGPVHLDGPYPLLAALLPSAQPPALTGTFDAALALRLAAGDPVSGTVDVSATEATAKLAGEFAALGPLSGKGRLRLPADDTPRALTFEGSLASLTLDTTGPLGFPLAHREDAPVTIEIRGELAEGSPNLHAAVRGLSLAGENNGHEVRFTGTSLDIDYRGPTLSATGASRFGTTPLSFTYEHEVEELPGDQWRLDGLLELSPATIADPITNAGAFNDLLDDVSFAGTVDSELKFQIGSESGFGGTARFHLTDCTAAMDDDLVVVTGLSGTGAVTIPDADDNPVTWQVEGTAAGVAIDTAEALDFPLAHTTEPPAAFTITGNTGADAAAEGTISQLTLDGEHRGEFVSFADTSLDFRLADDTLTAGGRTHYAGNAVPFTYTHTKENTPDGKWLLNGKIDVPLVALEQAVTNGGAFSEAATGMSFSGKTAAQSTFRIGPGSPFRGTLDFAVADGTLTLPDDGPTLTGVGGHFLTADLKSRHTAKPDRFSVAALTFGDLSFGNLTGRYQIHPSGDIALSGLEASFLGGHLTVDPFTYPKDPKKPFRMNIRFKGISLRTLTALFPAFDGQLDGTIDGHLPLVRKDGSYLPERGGLTLTPRTEARLRYNADNLFTGGLDPKSDQFKRMKLAEDSLKNLSIRTLNGRLFDPGDKDRAAVIRIEGQSPGVEGAPPIHLNFNFFEPEGEFRQLLDYFFKNRDKLDFGL